MPAKPRCALKTAFIGNRRFAGECDEATNEAATAMKQQATTACTAVWQTLIEGMEAALETPVPLATGQSRHGDPLPQDLQLRQFFSNENSRLAVLNSLAAGADLIGARTALEVGQGAAGVEVELEAVLPFAESDYPGSPERPRPEFRPDEAAALTDLAGRAQQVLRLDGHYEDSAGRRAAYEQCRNLLLHHADLLVAVYDPWATGRTGGTLDTVGQALKGGLPVVAVLLGGQETRIAVYTGGAQRASSAEAEWEQAVPLEARQWRETLATEVRHLLALPHQLAAPGENDAERDARLTSLAEAVRRLQLMYGEVLPHRWCRGAIMGAVFGTAWRMILGIGTFLSPATSHADPESEPPRDTITLAPYAHHYDRASELSEIYMRTYRGAFVLAFVLAGVAVAAAVALMAFGHSPPLSVVAILGGLKIAIIVFLIVLEHVSHQARYQEQATDFRYLAELLRPMQWLAPLAMRVPAANLPAHLAPLDPRHGWTPWLVRAVTRTVPPVSVCGDGDASASPRKLTTDGGHIRATLERARSEWLQGQLLYHRNNAQRMHAVDEGLERLAKGLLWAVLLLATGALALKLFTKLPTLPYLMGAGTAVLPAFIAALGGIMFQSEARRLHTRSDAMYHLIRNWQQALDQRIATLAEHADQGGGEFWPAASLLHDLSRNMIQETGDWKVLYQSHEIRAG